MEHYDPQMAKRVWQRVQGTGAAPGAELARMLTTQQELLSIYKQLAKALPDKATLFRELWEQTHRQWLCLSGVRLLILGGRPAQTPLNASANTPEALLRKAWAKAWQAIQLYAAAAATGGEYNFIYALLQEQPQAPARTILELLGTPPKKKG
mgnify:CR=1 FL=1